MCVCAYVCENGLVVAVGAPSLHPQVIHKGVRDGVPEIDMRGAQNKIPREELIAELHELADEVGGSPTMIKYVRYSERASQREFGRWNKTLLELGYEPPR